MRIISGERCRRMVWEERLGLDVGWDVRIWRCADGSASDGVWMLRPPDHTLLFLGTFSFSTGLCEASSTLKDEA